MFSSAASVRASAGRPAWHTVPRTLAAIAMAGLLLTACRADSFTSSQAADCTGQPGCRATSSPVDPTVYSALNDARLRLAPAIGTATTQAAIEGALHEISIALENGRTSDARAALARVYVELEPYRITLSDGTKIDPPDVAALRLGLVPAANTLGVHAQ